MGTPGHAYALAHTGIHACVGTFQGLNETTP